MRRVAHAVLIVALMFGMGCDPAFGQAGPVLEVDTLASMPVPDCDGVALGDIDRDGAVDILTSSGSEGGVLWFEQGETPKNWRRHDIYDDATEVEGNDLDDFDGDGQLEAISLDQKTGEILLHRPVDDPREEWNTTTIQSERLFVQASLGTDVDADGRPELVYTWEGTTPDAGGVHWLDFNEGAVHEDESWTDHTMIVHESAWWIAPQRLDLNDDGRAEELVFTARNIKNRNSGARPGLFWLEPNPDVNARWRRHAIDTTLPHPLHVDAGQFSSDSDSRDLMVGGFDTNTLYVYEWSDSWDRHELAVPQIDGAPFNQIWNVKAIPVPGRTRDAMLVVLSRSAGSAIVLYEPDGNEYHSRVVKQMPYTHPMDDRLVLHDLTGDGQQELIVPDSGGDQLIIFQFHRPH